jgi:predicted ATP-grasp superfamily ATP-dependent carboligase
MNVIVLDGNENQAVAATRSLARAGHEVHVGAETGWSKAGWSRACRSTFIYPSPQHDVPRFVDGIVDALRSREPSIVLPMTERSMLPLSYARDRLQACGGSLVLPDHDRVLAACDKSVTSRLARELGIAVPDTRVVGDDAVEARRIASDLAYPVVMKPAMSHEPGERRVRSTGAPVYAATSAEFLEGWRAMTARARTMLVQSFIPGGGVGYFALVRHGEVLTEFAHRRIRDVRPTGSGSAVRESAAMSTRLAEPSRALLRALGWHGVAMVEYRERPDGELVFLEVNGRFWNSLPLAIAAGVDFPRLLVELAVTDTVPSQPAYRTGVRCRWWLGDTRHLLQVWQGPPRGYPAAFPGRLATLAAFLTPRLGTVHDNFSLSDPLPELGDWLHFLGRKVPAALRRSGATGIHDVEGRTAHP